MTVKVTKDNFEQEVLQSDRPVLVDFWAGWCGPCKMLGPIIEKMSDDHPEYKVCKVNVDEQQELAGQFKVMSIPTVVAFKDGKKINQSVGLVAEDKLLDLLRN